MTPRRKTLGTVERRGAQFRAYYTRNASRHIAGHHFSNAEAAERWLTQEQALIDAGTWTPPAERRAQAAAVAEHSSLTLDTYAREWIAGRTTPRGGKLHPRTEAEYRRYLDGILEPLASRPLVELTPAIVARWHAKVADTPTLRHRAYAFARSVCKTAVETHKLIEVNPFQVEHATRRPEAVGDPNKTVRALDHAKVAELAGLVAPRDRALVLLLAYCCLRTGEAVALRRRDLVTGADAEGVGFGWLTVDKAISTYDGDRHEGPTKTGRKGERVIPVPPHLLPELTAHLGRFAEPGPSGLLFPSTTPSKAFRTSGQIAGHAEKMKRGKVVERGFGWNQARLDAGIPGARLHHLRHWGATLWAEAGAPEPLRIAILGHSQPGMTGAYTHPDTRKASDYARRVSELAGWSTGRPAGPSAAGSPAAAGSALAAALSALDDQSLAAALGALEAPQVTQIMEALPPARQVAVLAALVTPRPSFHVLDGGAQ